MMYVSPRLRRLKTESICVVFDIDGVLIDTSRSFPEAVSRAVYAYTYILGSSLWKPSLQDFWAFKAYPGFNNAWDIAEGMLIFKLQQQTCANPLVLKEFLKTTSQLGKGMAGVEVWMEGLPIPEQKKIQVSMDADLIKRLAMEYYAGFDYCQFLYGFVPVFGVERGTLEDETLLVDVDLLRRLPHPKAIYTGRNSKELHLALKRIGLEDWHASLIFYDDGATSGKPDPTPLQSILQATDSQGVLFAGDSRDDLETVLRYREMETADSCEFIQVRSGLKLDAHSFSCVDDVNQLLAFISKGGNDTKN